MNSETEKWLRIIRKGETLTTEFKSDKPLSDKELVATAMNLSNTEGGDIFLGVEDNGDVTGLHQNHLDTEGIAALIANRTSPPLLVKVESIELEGRKIARIKVEQSKYLTSTTDGLIQRRRIMSNGKPEAVPFLPHEFIQRQSHFGLVDRSAMPITDLSTKDLSPIERLRIREIIRIYGGDSTLLSLSDDELDGALGLTVTYNGNKYPSLAGVLIAGTEDLIRQFVPSYEVAFQILEGTEVRTNLFFRKPLLQVFDEIDKLFMARYYEKEIQIGMFRVPIPNFDKRGFREALVNALVHRDYTRLGTVHVRMDDNGLTISNPGGFVEGVTLNNLLVTEPSPRNPSLADICKRLGLAERTGRGIDRIYEGLLRYGRPPPDYTGSSSCLVKVYMSNRESDISFLELILNEENKLGKLPLDSLIILSRLRIERRLTTPELAHFTQKSEQETRNVLEKLVESGLIAAHGTGRARVYILGSEVYKQTGQKAGFVRQSGFDKIQQEQMILTFIKENKKIKRAEAADLCRISPYQANRILKKLIESGQIKSLGQGKGTYYERT